MGFVFISAVISFLTFSSPERNIVQRRFLPAFSKWTLGQEKFSKFC